MGLVGEDTTICRMLLEGVAKFQCNPLGLTCQVNITLSP